MAEAGPILRHYLTPKLLLRDVQSLRHVNHNMRGAMSAAEEVHQLAKVNLQARLLELCMSAHTTAACRGVCLRAIWPAQGHLKQCCSAWTQLRAPAQRSDAASPRAAGGWWSAGSLWEGA